MTNEEIAIKFEGVDHEIKSLKHRVGDVEKSSEALNRLATAVEVMATKQDGIGEKVDSLSTKVDTLERLPAKRWEFVVEKAIYVLVAAFVGYLLAGGL